MNVHCTHAQFARRIRSIGVRGGTPGRLIEAQGSAVCRVSFIIVKRPVRTIVVWLSIFALFAATKAAKAVSLGQSAAQSRTRNRSRDCTGAVVSTIMRFRRAMRPIVRLRATQSLHLRVSTTSARRRQPRPRKKEGAGCFTELQSPANKA